MADLDAIRQGLAANLVPLRTAKIVGQVSAYLLDNPQPPCLQVAGVDETDYDTGGYGAGSSDTWTILVEAALGLVNEMGAQKVLNALLETDAVKDALESDITLTSRLQDNGVVLAGQAAAAEWVKVRRYRGQTRFRFPSGAEMLLATWETEVQA